MQFNIHIQYRNSCEQRIKNNNTQLLKQTYRTLKWMYATEMDVSQQYNRRKFMETDVQSREIHDEEIETDAKNLQKLMYTAPIKLYIEY